MNKLTFLIIKPDAISRGLIGEIIRRFEAVELEILTIDVRSKNEDWFYQHYADVRKVLEPGYFHSMKYFMTTSRIIGVILRGEDAIKRVRKIVGATDCFQADLGTVRGDLGVRSDFCNLVHAADSQAAVKKEIALYFDNNTDQEEFWSGEIK